MSGTTMTPGQVRRWRVHVQQLHAEPGSVPATAVRALDLGVQETGEGAWWSLAVRGARVPDDAEERSAQLATAWTLRGAPHAHRRADLAGVARATAPFSEADAAKRVFDAARPLRAAGIPVLDALDAVAAAQRELAAEPVVKGDLSGALAQRLGGPYLRFCRPCGATHLHEQPFRLAALRGGLELVAGTSPPVLRRAAGVGPLPAGATAGSTDAPEHLDVVRAVLRLLGPATPQHVATYLDAPVADVKRRWPADAVAVSVDGEARWLLPLDDEGAPGGALDRVLAQLRDHADAVDDSAVRLLSAFDPLLQARDRSTLVADPALAEVLWPVLGRPGAVLVGADVVGTWRPRAAGRSMRLLVDIGGSTAAPVARAVQEQAERLAAHRGVRLAGVDVT